MPQILTICTGNIFRSMSAQFLMHAAARAQGLDLTVASAGTEALRQDINPVVRARLAHHGIDTSAHVQRKLTQEMLDRSDLVIVMGTDHLEHLRSVFGHNATLFFEASHGEAKGFPDWHEVFPHNKIDDPEVEEWLAGAVDTIHAAVPVILQRLPELIAAR